jgi:O-antigen ligase
MSNIGDASSSRWPARPALEVHDVIRDVLFLAVFFFILIGFYPFQDLTVPPPTEIAEGGNPLDQIGFTFLLVLLVGWVSLSQPARLKAVIRPALIATLIWFAICVVTSSEPAASARRFVLTVIVLAIAGIFLLLPRNQRHFGDLLAGGTLLILALCYFGIIFAPSVSIHQSLDAWQSQHAGSWRGLFNHKNQAGGVMAIFFFIGLFVMRTRSVIIGCLIASLSLVFLIFTFSKTSIVLLPMIMVISSVVIAVKGRFLRVATALGGLAMMILCSMGTVYFDSVRELLDILMLDTSFTGRTDIWRFALERLAERPLIGYGFSAYWGISSPVGYDMASISNWVTTTTDTHNAYLNIAVTTGIPGLILMVIWIIVLPILDFHRQSANPHTKFLSILFLRIWLYGIYASLFETLILQPKSSLWFMILVSIFGLRYLSVHRVKP